MTLSGFSQYGDLASMTLLVASLGMAGATIPASITAIKSNTRRSKGLVYLCLMMAVSFIGCNIDWRTGGLIEASSNIDSVRYSLWSLLPFVLANGYLIEFVRCRKCSSLVRRVDRAKRIKARIIEEAR